METARARRGAHPEILRQDPLNSIQLRDPGHSTDHPTWGQGGELGALQPVLDGSSDVGREKLGQRDPQNCQQEAGDPAEPQSRVCQEVKCS